MQMALDTMEPAARSELDRLPDAAWRALAGPLRGPMNDHLWARACVGTFNAAEDVRLLSVGEPTSPRAFAALVPSRSRLDRLTLVGNEETAEPMDVHHGGPESLADLARLVAATRRPFAVTPLPAGSPTIAALKRAYRGRGLVLTVAAKGCPFVRLGSGWRPETHFGPSRLADFRRKQRHAEKLGRVETEIFAPTIDRIDALLDEAFEVEARSWKGDSGTALALDQRRGAFFRRYARLATEAGVLRMCFLRIDGRAVAMQIAVECDGALWQLKIGYDAAYRRCSPGNLLILESMRWAAARGLESFEFLGQEAPWTRAWTDTTRPMVALRTYPANLHGLAALAADGAALAARKLGKHMARGRAEAKPKARGEQAE